MKKILICGAALLALCAATVSCKKQEKIDPTMPSVVWEENSGFSTVEIVDGFSAPITVTAPQGLDVLTITGQVIPTSLLATANNLIGTSANKGTKPVFDLIDDAGLAKSIAALGFPTGASQRGKSTALKFDLAKLVSTIIGDNAVLVQNNDNFEFEIRVRDVDGNETRKTARFHNTSAPELTVEPAEVELNSTSSVGAKVKVKAEGKLKGLSLTVKSSSNGIRSFISKRSSAAATGTADQVVDLVSDEKAVSSFGALGLPTGDKVSGKELELDLTKLLDQLKVEVEQTATSAHTLTVTATDENGKKGHAAVILRYTK